MIKWNEKNSNSRNGMEWTLVGISAATFQIHPARSEDNNRKDLIKGKGFEWMEVWADYIVEFQIISQRQTSNLYLTLRRRGV